MRNMSEPIQKTEKEYPSEADRMEQVAMALKSIHSALTEINENRDYEISEHLEEITDSLKWFDDNCY